MSSLQDQQAVPHQTFEKMSIWQLLSRGNRTVVGDHACRGIDVPFLAALNRLTQKHRFTGVEVFRPGYIDDIQHLAEIRTLDLQVLRLAIRESTGCGPSESRANPQAGVSVTQSPTLGVTRPYRPFPQRPGLSKAFAEADPPRNQGREHVWTPSDEDSNPARVHDSIATTARYLRI